MKIKLRILLLLAAVSFFVSNPRVLAHTDLTAQQARDLIDSTSDLIVVDVREPYEYCGAIGHIPGALNYPWSSGVLQARYEELPTDGPVLVVCHSGGRSNSAANFLDSNGFSPVYDMMGGMSAWQWETAPCKYSGGSGTSDDPYQIATAADLIALGETPEDYDKHFILTADIDLDPNLPGRKVFDGAVIATPHVNDATYWFEDPFTGVFNGNGHTIFHLTIIGGSYMGLFGQLGEEGSSVGEVKNLGLEAIDVNATGSRIGSLVGRNYGSITECYSAGRVNGYNRVGGLVGSSGDRGSILTSYSAATVSGGSAVGGLVGYNRGTIATSYSTGTVSGDWNVGGLVGMNGDMGQMEEMYGGTVLNCYSTGAVAGGSDVGGLVGLHYFGGISNSYSTGMVTGNARVGGLVGSQVRVLLGSVEASFASCFWDIEASGQVSSAGGTGMTTSEMQSAITFLIWSMCGNEGIWTINDGRDYPRLWWENRPGEPIAVGATLSDMLAGAGTEYSPHLIYTADELNLIGLFPCDWDKHFRLMSDIDLSDYSYDTAVIAPYHLPAFTGVFNGNGFVVSNLHIQGGRYLGLFGQLGSEAEVSNLGLELIDINGTGDFVGGLAGWNFHGRVTACHSTGTVKGNNCVGGLMGWNDGSVATSYSTGTVTGYGDVGGLVGSNNGSIGASYSTGAVTGDTLVGGLVGDNHQGMVTASYSTSTVSGSWRVGGLASSNGGTITMSYSIGAVTGNEYVGGLVGYTLVVWWGNYGSISTSFWDIHTSGQTHMCGSQAEGASGCDDSFGLTTAEMRTAATFLEAGWDFVDETANGPNDIWKIVEGQTYPLLSWQKYGGGTGEPNNPYLIYTAEHLNALGAEPNDYNKHFKLMADIDLSGYTYDRAVIAPDMNDTEDWFQGTPFTGVFDGDNHTILHVTITGVSHLGLIGNLESGAMITDVRLEAVDVNGTGENIGGLVGYNGGSIRGGSSTGRVSGRSAVGGCVGRNGLIFSPSHMTSCYSNVTITGRTAVGGLVGYNLCNITASYSTGAVDGEGVVGGLVGHNLGLIANSRSVCSVFGHNRVGGFIGSNGYNPRVDTFLGPTPGSIANCYSAGSVSGMGWSVGGFVGENSLGEAMNSFWDMDTSGQTESDGGTGLTTTEMQTGITFLYAGWDFVEETTNGTEDIWWILEGQDYPRLWWELNLEN